MMSCPRFKRTYGIKPLFFSEILGLLCLLLLCLSAPASGEIAKSVSSESQKFTEQENWVLGQIDQGKEADLKQQFVGDQQCLLSANFLQKLFNDACRAKICKQGVQITNARITGDLDLDNVEINYPVYLKKCTFEGQVTFKRGYVKKDLSFEGSEFLKSVNFSGIKIDGNFICDKAHFEDECFWWDARIALEFQAVGVEFRSSKAQVDFNSMAVSDSAHFRNGRFYGPTSFRRTRFGKQFDARAAQFLDPKGPAIFFGMKAGHVLLNNAEFYGGVTFEMMEIGESFWASGAKFLNEHETNNFTSIKIGHKCFMDNTIIRGVLDFSFANFNDLEIDGAATTGKNGPPVNETIPLLKLQESLIQRDLIIRNESIDELNARQMQVKGHTTIQNTQIKKIADFRGGSFQTLTFANVRWPEANPQQPGKEGKKPFRYYVYLGGISFSSMTIDKPGSGSEVKLYDSDYNDEDFKKIANFMDACPFNTQGYVQLEAFFKGIGRESWANNVFMRMNARELAQKMKWYDPRRWLEWFFWGKIAGYGRAPFRVFFLGLAFVILGACLFNPVYLKEYKVPNAGKRYRSVFIRLFISLDRFLPIELGLAKNYDVQDRSFFVWLYFFLHQVLGWILIPIGLASIYSQLK